MSKKYASPITHFLKVGDTIFMKDNENDSVVTYFITDIYPEEKEVQGLAVSLNYISNTISQMVETWHPYAHDYNEMPVFMILGEDRSLVTSSYYETTIKCEVV